MAAADVIADRTVGGGSLRGAMGMLVDCTCAAREVARRCVGPLCVGHEAELATVCERGLDLVVDQVHEKMRDLDFKAVHFLSGEAVLVDAADGQSPDGVADRFDRGAWQASA